MTVQEELVKLITENSTLPIIPLVNGELCVDNDLWQLGSFIYVNKGEFALYKDRWYDNRRDFVENYYIDNEDTLCDKFNFRPDVYFKQSVESEFTEDELQENYKAKKKLDEYLNTEIVNEYFTNAILLYISFPDKEEIEAIEIK